ncbi:hypothetical protein ISS42_00515 [Candidatus Shapirobacteria bacterium]|nr:hypothetical protein [Candidatus Shapirobacteria bacterium]
MASKRFWLIITVVFSLLFILGISSGGECRIIGWRALKEKDNLNLQLKMAGCFLENKEFGKTEEKLEEVNNLVKADDLFLSEQIAVYEARLRAADSQKRQKEILFWKQRVVANPPYPDAWASLGLLWRQQGEEQKSRLSLKKACSLAPGREDIVLIANQLGFLCQ